MNFNIALHVVKNAYVKDGKLYLEAYVFLNLAVGDDFLPNPDESTEFPQALVVDYVRVYQK